MSLASFVSWRDSLYIMPGPPPAADALELGSLVKVKRSGLWLYGVVKDIKADTHPGFVAVEMVGQDRRAFGLQMYVCYIYYNVFLCLV